MRVPDEIVERGLLLLALSSLAILLSIAFFIFREGAPLIFHVGLANFFSSDWHPTGGKYSISLMIVASAAVTLGALAVGLPLGISCAIVLSELVPMRTRQIIKPAIEILAGIPSVVYGFMGMVVVMPFIRQHLGGSGASGLAAAVILGIMILPTIIAISLDALQAVPRSYREGSLALGATRWQTIRRVVLPAARSGLVAAVILGMGRAVGMVFQRPNPFPLSIRENVVYGPRIHGLARRVELEAIAERCLAAVGLWSELKDRLNESALAITTEQMQRLCIARALAVEPDILLMDEPCSALDPIATLRVEALMRELTQRYTIVVVTHNMQQAARISDDTGFLLLGELIEMGPTAEVFTCPRDRRTEDYVTGRYG